MKKNALTMVVFGGFLGPGAIRCGDSARRYMSRHHFKMHCHEIHVRLQTPHFIARYEFRQYDSHEVVLGKTQLPSSACR
jgi:hypothetical protein